MLRETAHVSFDTATESALSAIAAEMNMSRPELIRMALVDWLESHKTSRAAAND